MDIALKLMTGMGYRYGTHLVMNTKKFYNEKEQPITMYSICDSYKNAEGWHNEELFKAASIFQVVFFLRDLYMAFQGIDAEPIDDERWQRVRAKNDVDEVIRKYKEKYLGSDELQVHSSGD